MKPILTKYKRSQPTFSAAEYKYTYYPVQQLSTLG
jgi:hypothetical protein